MSARILVADDEESILDLLSRFLEKQGYQVDVANSVDTALALLRENRYDVVLTDKNMPDLSGRTEGGMEIVRFVREQMPESEVIMITGYATIETAVEAMKLGAFDYIMKPIPLNELKEKIERILEYRRYPGNLPHALQPGVERAGKPGRYSRRTGGAAAAQPGAQDRQCFRHAEGVRNHHPGPGRGHGKN